MFLGHPIQQAERYHPSTPEITCDSAIAFNTVVRVATFPTQYEKPLHHISLIEYLLINIKFCTIDCNGQLSVTAKNSRNRSSGRNPHIHET